MRGALFVSVRAPRRWPGCGRPFRPRAAPCDLVACNRLCLPQDRRAALRHRQLGPWSTGSWPVRRGSCQSARVEPEMAKVRSGHLRIVEEGVEIHPQHAFPGRSAAVASAVVSHAQPIATVSPIESVSGETSSAAAASIGRAPAVSLRPASALLQNRGQEVYRRNSQEQGSWRCGRERSMPIHRRNSSSSPRDLLRREVTRQELYEDRQPSGDRLQPRALDILARMRWTCGSRSARTRGRAHQPR